MIRPKTKEKLVVSVVGGGWSFASVDHAKLPGVVIAVNDAAVHLSRRPDIVVSMDRLWTEGRWDHLVGMKSSFYVRRAAFKNIRPTAEEWPWVFPFDCDINATTFSFHPSTLNGSNSGACAMNLAHIMRPDELYLFGFDMCRNPKTNDPYWHPVYQWANPRGGTKDRKYLEWAQEFEWMAAEFNAIGTLVRNVSPRSAITAFTRVAPADIGVAR